MRPRISCFLTLVLCLATASAAEEQSSGVDLAALDRYLYDSLRHVINYGVESYNSGDIDSCTLHFRQTLQGIRPLLAHRPELQKSIETALAQVEGNTTWRLKMVSSVLDGNRPAIANPTAMPIDRQKAFALRAVLNEVREGLRIERKEAAKPETLWDRLGGEKGITRIVGDLTNAAAADARVNFDRNGRFKLDARAAAEVQGHLIDMISEASGGPRRYRGRTMKEIHKGMGITDGEFDALKNHFRQALEKNGVKPPDVLAVLAVVEKTRGDMVEPRPVESGKPMGKKPETAKSDPKSEGREVLKVKPSESSGKR